MQQFPYRICVLLFAEHFVKRQGGVRMVFQFFMAEIRNLAVVFQICIVTVFCNLTQPDPHITITAKMVYGSHGFEKCFTGDFFCQRLVSMG